VGVVTRNSKALHGIFVPDLIGIENDSREVGQFSNGFCYEVNFLDGVPWTVENYFVVVVLLFVEPIENVVAGRSRCPFI